MVQIKSFVYLLSAAALAVATPTKRTVAQVQSDIAVINTRVTNLNNLITAYPLSGGTLGNALGIHTSAGTVITALVTATADVASTPAFNVADGTAILTSVQAFSPTIQSALTGIVAKRPAFVALPLGGVPALVLQDLKYLSGNTTAFANGLISKSPSSLTAEATSLRDSILAAFTTAIAAYDV